MEIGLAVLAFFVAWAIVRHISKKEADKAALGTFEVSSDGAAHHTWTCSFREMTCVVEWWDPDSYSETPKPETEMLRRTKEGVWQTKRSAEAVRAEARALKAELAENPTSIGAGMLQQQLDDLSGPIRWVDLPEETQAPLTTAYERFLRQG